MKYIQLTKGFLAIVDDDEYDWLSSFDWHSAKGYAATGGRRQVYMHKMVMKVGNDQIVDHINGNSLDNRKENLRLATKSQNCINQKLMMRNTSGYRGVTWHKQAQKYSAQITVKRKYHHLGLFKISEDAARAYDEAATKLHGEFARLNFPK